MLNVYSGLFRLYLDQWFCEKYGNENREVRRSNRSGPLHHLPFPFSFSFPSPNPWSKHNLSVIVFAAAFTYANCSPDFTVCGKQYSELIWICFYYYFQVTVESQAYHKSCFKCSHGGCAITPSNYAALEGILYCKHHFSQLFKEKGSYNHLIKSASIKRSAASVPEAWIPHLYLSSTIGWACFVFVWVCIFVTSLQSWKKKRKNGVVGSFMTYFLPLIRRLFVVWFVQGIR